MKNLKPIERYRFKTTEHYWERRYQQGQLGGTEGAFDAIADFKSRFLNNFVKENDVKSVIDFGCGDGCFLCYCRFPEYTGYEVSQSALRDCQEYFFLKYPQWQFFDYRDYDGRQAELALSLDVIDYLVEDHTYIKHMRDLFAAATRYVIIYSSDIDNVHNDDVEGVHVRQRKFTDWIADNVKDFVLKERFDGQFNKSLNPNDFFVYERVAGVVQR
ncbi:MAG: class I SAM-dependent methyltransferase [Alphaproteobacteria bacterium]|nr:class I SAM-dependent methyltransferase [Alphaproteobacteria bacterium]